MEWMDSCMDSNLLGDVIEMAVMQDGTDNGKILIQKY